MMDPTSSTSLVTVNLNGHAIHCDVARTYAEHSLGLQRYASLAPDEGLLFHFDRPAYRHFTMKEVRFPIDIVFIRDGRVTRIAEFVEPGDTELYAAGCDLVLEVKAGTCRRTALRLGDGVQTHIGREVQTSKMADSFNEWSPQVQEIRKRDDRANDEQSNAHQTPDKVTDSSSGTTHSMNDEPKEQYFHELWPDALADEALDVRPELQTRHGNTTRKTAGRSIVVTIPKGKMGEIVREEADVARREKDGEALNYFWQMGRLPKEQPDRIYFAWDGAVQAYHQVTGMDRDGGRIYMDTAIHDLPRPVEMGPFRGFKYFDYPAVSVAASQKRAQIVDEEKFVEKAAPILFAHADVIPWQKDVLNGGATERAVVTRSDLAQWLGGNQESGEGAAEPGSVTFLLQAAGDERGMRLLGQAFVLAELADFSRLGFRGRVPALVLYRSTATA